MKKLRQRKVRWLAQGHTLSKLEEPGLHETGSLARGYSVYGERGLPGLEKDGSRLWCQDKKERSLWWYAQYPVCTFWFPSPTGLFSSCHSKTRHRLPESSLPTLWMEVSPASRSPLSCSAGILYISRSPQRTRCCNRLGPRSCPAPPQLCLDPKIKSRQKAGEEHFVDAPWASAKLLRCCGKQKTMPGAQGLTG